MLKGLVVAPKARFAGPVLVDHHRCESRLDFLGQLFCWSREIAAVCRGEASVADNNQGLFSAFLVVFGPGDFVAELLQSLLLLHVGNVSEFQELGQTVHPFNDAVGEDSHGMDDGFNNRIEVVRPLGRDPLWMLNVIFDALWSDGLSCDAFSPLLGLACACKVATFLMIAFVGPNDFIEFLPATL